MSKIAIIQDAPVVLDRVATIEKMVARIGEVAGEGAELVVFPEAFIPGYPAWIWRLRPGSDWTLSEAIHARLLDNAVSMESDQLQPLYDAAKTYRVTVVCGINERDSRLGRTTLYNSVVTVGPDGTLLNHHRKLMPTNPERMVWGFGDATGLKVVDTPAGRIGAMPCWENYMPLARYALYSQGIEIYVAPTYDAGEVWLSTLRHIAREGACWVLGSGVVLNAGDIPDDLPGRAELYPEADEWVNPGDSVVIAPGGAVVAGPMHNEKGILYADLDIAQVTAARRSLDVVGHYARPDIFTLRVNAKPQSPVAFD